MLALGIVTATATACGTTHTQRPLHGSSEAVRILKAEGYAVPTLPPAPPGATSVTIALRFDSRYGAPVAYLHKGDLYVLVARGDSRTPRVPGALWHRFGETLLIGWPSGSRGRAQFQEAVEAL